MTTTPRKSPTRAPRKAAAPKAKVAAPTIEDAVTAPRLKDEEPAAPLGRFAQLAAEATANYVPHEPYVIGADDGILPDIVITEPVETERVVAMAFLFDRDVRKMNPQDFQPVLSALCGDVFDRVWNELLVGKHIVVAAALVDDIKAHFYTLRKPVSAGTDALPGKSTA